MTALLDRFTVTKLSRHITEIVVAYLTAFIAFGGGITGPAEWVVVAQIILAIKLHVFALPLAFTPVLAPVPPWAWYVVVVMWLSKAVQHSGYTVSDMAEELERAYLSTFGRGQAAERVVTDGGSENMSETDVIVRVEYRTGLDPERLDEYVEANYPADETVVIEDAESGEELYRQGNNVPYDCPVCGKSAYSMSVVHGIKRWHHGDSLCRRQTEGDGNDGE